jgi:hypothetical protein
MRKLMNSLVLSCKKASELIDKKSVVVLTVKEKVMLNIHKSICKGCRAYQEQSILLDELIDEYIHQHNETNVPQFMNNELRQQIISKM